MNGPIITHRGALHLQLYHGLHGNSVNCTWFIEITLIPGHSLLQHTHTQQSDCPGRRNRYWKFARTTLLQNFRFIGSELVAGDELVQHSCASSLHSQSMDTTRHPLALPRAQPLHCTTDKLGEELLEGGNHSQSLDSLWKFFFFLFSRKCLYHKFTICLHFMTFIGSASSSCSPPPLRFDDPLNTRACGEKVTFLTSATVVVSICSVTRYPRLICRIIPHNEEDVAGGGGF